MVAFATAAGAMVLLIFSLAVAIATAQEELVAALRARSSEVRRWGGWVMLAVGVWVLALAVLAPVFRRVFPV